MRVWEISFCVALALSPCMHVGAQFPNSGGGSPFAAGTPTPSSNSSAIPNNRPTVQTSTADKPLATRQMSFTIPFSIDRTGGDVAEVQLVVSADQGANWHIYSKQKPGNGNFQFRAARDGEYWFASRTIDSQNRISPPGPTAPELRVLIDTAMPRVTLQATVSPAGDVKTTWEIQDEHLDPQSFSLEYQPAPGEPWQQVAVDPSSLSGDSPTRKGQLTWWPKTNSKVINVKAEVRDQAGNLGVVQKRIFLPASAQRKLPATGSTTSTPNFPAANSGAHADPFARAFGAAAPTSTGSPSVNSVPPASMNAATSTDPFRSTASSPPNNSFAAPPVVPNTLTPSPSNFAPNTLAAPPVPPMPWSNQGLSSGTPPGPPPTYPPQPNSQFVSQNGDHLNPTPVPPAQNSSTQNPPPQTALSPTPPGKTNAAVSSQPPLAGELPGGERPRMTNSKRFALEYDIESVGPGGVAEVELWGTKDRGATWTRWSTDADRQSPYEVEVPQEGVFGFRIVIISKSGLASPSPQSGDVADLWVGVDVTPPHVELTSISYGEAAFAGQLDIRWEAHDQGLGTRPISLLFAEKADGPWTTIASGLPNSGQYYWNVDARVPKKVYLRIEIRDEAGNAAQHQTPQTISLEGLTPGGRIKGFHSSNNLLPGASRR